MLVEGGFDNLVEDAARSARKRNPYQSGEGGLPVDQGVGREYFANGCGKDEERDDAGFGQYPEVVEEGAGVPQGVSTATIWALSFIGAALGPLRRTSLFMRIPMAAGQRQTRTMAKAMSRTMPW